jgi:hypothetical protein
MGRFHEGEMKRLIGATVFAMGLALAVACGSGGGAEQPGANTGNGRSAEAGPSLAAASLTALATPTAESVPDTASDLRERLEEMALDEADVPPRFSSMGSWDLDIDFDLLPGPSPQQGVMYTAVFTTPGEDETIVSMVILMEHSEAVEEVFAEMEKVSAEGLQDFFDIVGDYSQGTFVVDVRELDVSALGYDAKGLRITLDTSGAGASSPEPDAIDEQMVYVGRGPVVAIVQTVAVGGGTAVDALPLAQTMVDKIEAVVQ